MIMLGVKMLRVTMRNTPRRYHEMKFSAEATHSRLTRSRETEQQVKSPNFNKEFKGMKAKFPCLERLFVKIYQNAY